MADDVLRTRRMRRENSLLCARSVLSVSAAVRCFYPSDNSILGKWFPKANTLPILDFRF